MPCVGSSGNGADDKFRDRASKRVKSTVTTTIYKFLLSVLLGVAFAFWGNDLSGRFSSTQFSVLGIEYTIVMSLLTTFSTADIKNTTYRKKVKRIIKENIVLSTVDFSIPMMFYVIGCFWPFYAFPVAPAHCFTSSIFISLFSLTRCFFYIRKLNEDIEEKIFEERQLR